MELELQKERFECYRAATAIIATQEETSETIVPDYSPDVSRIVSTNACLLVGSRTVVDGKLTVNGSAKTTVLYMAEDGQGLRSLEYSLPIEHSAALPQGSTEAAVEGRVCDVEARLLNPRKLFIRIHVEWRIMPFARATLTTCSAIPEQNEYAIETLCEKREVSLIRSISEKDFAFSDEITIPNGREPVRELLSSRVKLRLTEAKSIGGKAILKGVACVSLLYVSQGDKICSYAEELPFSQILEGDAEENGEGSVSAVLTLSGCEVRAGGENDERTVSVKLFINAFIALRKTQPVACITDLYSTAYDLDAQMESVDLPQKPEVQVISQSIREQLDTGTEVECVLCADVSFGSVSVQHSGTKASVQAAAAISVLYLDESGVPLCAERHIEIASETDVPPDALASVENVCAGDITTSLNANGIEIRFPAEVTVVSAASPQCVCITSLQAEKPKEGEAACSLVLRALEDGEKLWDVAKRYRTTMEEILSANELTDETAVEAGRMLLIPRKR